MQKLYFPRSHLGKVQKGVDEPEQNCLEKHKRNGELPTPVLLHLPSTMGSTSLQVIENNVQTVLV